jgi:hypothetical protein
MHFAKGVALSYSHQLPLIRMGENPKKLGSYDKGFYGPTP